MSYDNKYKNEVYAAFINFCILITLVLGLVYMSC
jgi:hypothetical protein